jgi:hypothetical protein
MTCKALATFPRTAKNSIAPRERERERIQAVGDDSPDTRALDFPDLENPKKRKVS